MLVFFLDVSIEECSSCESFVALLAFEHKIARWGVTQFKVTPNLRHRAPIFGVSFHVAVWRIQAVRMSAVVTTVFPEKKKEIRKTEQLFMRRRRNPIQCERKCSTWMFNNMVTELLKKKTTCSKKLSGQICFLLRTSVMIEMQCSLVEKKMAR